MLLLRSTIFNLFFYLWTLFVCIICIPLLVLPPNYVVLAGRLWAHGVVIAARILVGIAWEVRGKEKIPEGACIIASKHQSAFETVVFYLLCQSPVYVLKKELKYLPLFGWYISRIKTIAVDRKAGMRALKDLVRQAQDRLSRGRQIVIFPEGTRVAYGKKGKYQAGLAAIYNNSDAPVVTVALNSGKYWGKNSWIKQPGIITFEFLEVIENGLKKDEFMTRLESSIENGCKKLED